MNLQAKGKSVNVVYYPNIPCDMFQPQRLGQVLNLLSTYTLHASVFGKHFEILKYAIKIQDLFCFEMKQITDAEIFEDFLTKGYSERDLI